ncbi:ATP-binding protein [Leptolyngbya subtilissima ST-M1]|uniref:ATP-binding protein n=1 Tax=Cyanophyceae TaxID=3028117 RepID=UPI0018EF93AB|nr:ATP-binding protein [Nodosilinea sp. FACHB-131]
MRIAQATGADTAVDPYRGLHIDESEVNRLLNREPGVPAFQVCAKFNETIPAIAPQPGSRLEWLKQNFELTEFDLDVVVIALAPELDRRYERLYAYLQDDVRCKRPTIDLALNLLCTDAVEKLERRSHFTSAAPLLHNQLLHLQSELTTKPTFLAQELHLDSQVLRFLLAQPGLDASLSPFCQLLTAAPESKPESLNDLALHQVTQAWQNQQPLRLYFQGRDRLSQRRTALSLAYYLKVPLLQVDLPRLVAVNVDLEPTLRRVWREAEFQRALLYLEGVEAFTPEQRLGYQSLLRLVATTETVVVLAGTGDWAAEAIEPPLVVVVVPFLPLAFTQRRQCWQKHLTEIGVAADEAISAGIVPTDLDALADRFGLTAAQIAEAVAVARNTAQWQGVPTALPHLFTAARAQAGRELQGLARKIEPKYHWDDIVLRPDAQLQLQELCRQSQYRHVVFDAWKFDQKLSLGKGINALFSGPPGTGKTMAAEVIAHELQLDLYKIDLSKIVSKYIGETEKNLDRIFTAAANSNAILLFDEADALFGKRSEVQDAHDRYANIEVGYLLQKMEEYEGIALLTSNLRSSLDAAFVRRLRFIIEFPLPDASDRYHIWQQVWPDSTSLAADVNLNLLAQKLEVTGAEIRNIALAAAFLAAAEGQSIGMSHLKQAVRREFQKMGKLLMENMV